MANVKDLTGRVFGRLTVIKQNGWYTSPTTGSKVAKLLKLPRYLP